MQRMTKPFVAGLALAVVTLAAPHAQADDSGSQTVDTRIAEQQASDDIIVVPGPTQERHQEREVVTRTNTPLVVSGLVTFGLAYGISAGIAAGTDSAANDRLYVPVAGPWLSLSDRPDCPADESGCDRETTKKIGLAVDGVVQAAGVVTFVYGLMSPINTTVAGREVVNLQLTPAEIGQGRGLALSGAF